MFCSMFGATELLLQPSRTLQQLHLEPQNAAATLLHAVTASTVILGDPLAAPLAARAAPLLGPAAPIASLAGPAAASLAC